MVSIDVVGLCYVRVQSRVLSDSAVKHIRENYRVFRPLEWIIANTSKIWLCPAPWLAISPGHHHFLIRTARKIGLRNNSFIWNTQHTSLDIIFLHSERVDNFQYKFIIWTSLSSTSGIALEIKSCIQRNKSPRWKCRKDGLNGVNR